MDFLPLGNHLRYHLEVCFFHWKIQKFNRFKFLMTPLKHSLGKAFIGSAILGHTKVQLVIHV